MGDDELGAKVVALVKTRVDRVTANLERKLRLRTTQRDLWQGKARAAQIDLREANKRIALLEKQLRGPPDPERNPIHP